MIPKVTEAETKNKMLFFIKDTPVIAFYSSEMNLAYRKPLQEK